MPQKTETKAKYAIGEKLLCYHGPLLYEAKCIEIQEGNEVRYLIHYQGWNKTWDEWVNDSRILKFNEVGIKRQKELQDVYRESRKKKESKKKFLADKKKSKSSHDKPRFMGSASETSNRSFGESEDGKASKVTTEDENLENKTDAGTSVMSEEMDEQKSSSVMDKSISSSKGRSSRKRIASNSEQSADKTPMAGGYEEKQPQLPTTMGMAGALTGSIAPDDDSCCQMNTAEATNSNKSTNSSRSKKSRLVPLDESVLDLDTYVTGINIQTLKFVFSDNLRAWLADDWDLITRQSRLTRLPSRMTADQVLGLYKVFCESIPIDDPENEAFHNRNREMRLEFVEGIRKLFNTSFGSLLLYKFERLQYSEVLNSNESKADLSSIYGSMYILRLLVNIKKIITYTRTDITSNECLSELIQHFIEFLSKRADDLFKLEDYITATADYTRRAMC